MNQVINVTGKSMPTVGLGLWKIDPGAVADAVYQAIKVGYRHLDSAADYGNEKEVGEAGGRAKPLGREFQDDEWGRSLCPPFNLQ